MRCAKSHSEHSSTEARFADRRRLPRQARRTGRLRLPIPPLEFVNKRHIAFDDAECFREALSPKLESEGHAPRRYGDHDQGQQHRPRSLRSRGLAHVRLFAAPEFLALLNHDVLHPGFLREWAHSPEFTDQLKAMKDSTDMAPYLSLTDQTRTSDHCAGAGRAAGDRAGAWGAG